MSDRTIPALPRLYELIELERADSALAEGCRRAESGAEEGTLVWVRRATQAEGRPGRRWQPAADALHAALVLRPEMALEEAAQVVFVGALSVGQALAEHVPALVELHYRWPNDVLLRHGKVAGLQLRAGPLHQGVVPWLVLGVSLNVAGAPPELGFRAASVREEGESDAGAGELLEGFARSFLSWVNRWADDGFEPVRKAWLQRVSALERDLSLELEAGTLYGRFADLGPQGELELRGRDGAQRTVTVVEFFGLSRGDHESESG